MYRSLTQFAILVAIPCACFAQMTITQKQGVTTYCEVRKSQYFGYPITQEQEQQMLVFKKQYPAMYLNLNEMTNKAEMPGSRYVPFAWVPRYIDPVAELFSHWFGWHNAILDALRPEVDTYQTHYHEQNVDTYLDAVRRYIYNRHDIESHDVNTIFMDLIKHVEPFPVYRLPYQHNIFAQIMPTISYDEIQTILKTLQSEIPERYQEKRDLIISIYNHFGYTKLAIEALSKDIVEPNTTA